MPGKYACISLVSISTEIKVTHAKIIYVRFGAQHFISFLQILFCFSFLFFSFLFFSFLFFSFLFFSFLFFSLLFSSLLFSSPLYLFFSFLFFSFLFFSFLFFSFVCFLFFEIRISGTGIGGYLSWFETKTLCWNMESPLSTYMYMINLVLISLFLISNSACSNRIMLFYNEIIIYTALKGKLDISNAGSHQIMFTGLK